MDVSVSNAVPETSTDSMVPLRHRVDAAMGRCLADSVLCNAKIVDVLAHRIFDGEVAFADGVIVGVVEYPVDYSRTVSSENTDAVAQNGSPGEATIDANVQADNVSLYFGLEIIDLEGRYLVPGFIDGHMHIESSMVTPSEYAHLTMPLGVTTVIADPHEIANVCGEAGLRFMLKSAATSPLDFKIMLPSCVPATPFEHAGATIDAAETRRLLDTYPFFGLGEMMNCPGVVAGDVEVLAKINNARLSFSGIVDGHAPFIDGYELNAYASSGILTDHECTDADEVVDKVSRGMYVLIREGSCSRDLDVLMGAVLAHPGVARRCCFCTDDRSPSDILEYGTVNYCVRRAIELGLDPIDAVTMATLNTAECYGLAQGGVCNVPRGAIAPGWRADLVVADDFEFRFAERVYSNGRLVAKDNTPLFEAQPVSLMAETESDVFHTMHLPDITTELFEYLFDPEIPVIGVAGGTVNTRKIYCNNDAGLSRVAVVERHGRSAAANDGMTGVGTGFVSGYGITGGAIAASIGHDSHNVCVIGDTPSDMAFAVNALDDGGIAVVSDGAVIGRIELPIAGLMSDRSAPEVAAQHEAAVLAAHSLGIPSELDPFMVLVFLPLPVIPELRITDQGLFDVTEFAFIGNE